ncbi:glycosyltransferase family 2 protein [Pedobacter sp. AW31-3R]|uniref:glycosyltransferase family 2 protein n=1 Tax=Pedobacter sp. AW31-3R TaxID=3445781 RepID=UPI003F9FD439
MDTSPFFSVIIPVHNKLPHLERSINSVLKQTYANLELIVVDDASSDGSSEKLMEFTDPRLTLLKRNVPGAGGYAARNLGIKHAAHDWICFLDADDEWNLNLLNTIKDTVLLHQGMECITWGWMNVNGEKKVVDKTSRLNTNYPFRNFDLKDLFNQRHTLWTGAVCFKKGLITRAGMFPETGFKRGGDVDTWIRCLYYSKGNVWINKVMSFYYQDAVNMVTKTIKRESLYIFSPFLLKLKKDSENVKLVDAIKSFQNNRIYTILRWQIIERQPLDYELIRSLNFSPEVMPMMGKLLYNKVKYTFKSVEQHPAATNHKI